MTSECIFCKIVKDEIPSTKVYEDEDFIAFMDIRPINRGQVLVIPREHYRWVYDVPNRGEYWEAANKVAEKVIKGLKADHVSFVTLGHEIPHAHIWVVPRYADDGHGGFLDWSKAREASREELDELASLIRKA